MSLLAGRKPWISPDGILLWKRLKPVFKKFTYFVALTIAGQGIVITLACTVASRVLHSTLFSRILHAPISFFETTPAGRILNRLSRDMDEVDSRIRLIMAEVFRGIASLITSIIAISYSTPFFLITLVPIMIIYYLLQVRGQQNILPDMNERSSGFSSS